MGDRYPVHRVAAVQAVPVFMDREASVEKACRLVAEAASGGARLAVFPEAWIPGFPIWVERAPGAALWNHEPAKQAFTRLLANAVEIPGPATDALCEAAREAGCGLVMGLNERESGRPSGTLYNTIVYIDADGQLLGKHRKLVPTYAERLIWGQGDGSTLGVFDSPAGPVGGLICWEHWMPLARHAMHAQGEQVHAALWPEVDDIHLVASRHYAFEGRCFVVSVGSVLRRRDIPEDLELFREAGIDPDEQLLSGGSSIIGPDGNYLAGPADAEETILYADLDTSRIAAEQQTFDPVGHYSRPDIFSVSVDTTSRTYLRAREDRY
ncbi:MAG: carbon-nitrogen hydrolase family protein [Actinomycetota bacterium]